MSNPKSRGPRALSEILGELFTARGYSRLRAIGAMEEAWNAAVGEPQCHQTRLGELRRGVLNVTVAHPTLLEELAAFRKPELLRALRASAPGTAIHDIRFRIGAVQGPEVLERADPLAPGSRVGTPTQSPAKGSLGTSRPGRPRAGHHEHKRSAGEG